MKAYFIRQTYSDWNERYPKGVDTFKKKKEYMRLGMKSVQWMSSWTIPHSDIVYIEWRVTCSEEVMMMLLLQTEGLVILETIDVKSPN